MLLNWQNLVLRLGRGAAKAGGDVVHTQADPSRTELARRDFEKKRKEADAQKQREIAERYGSAAASDAPEERALRGARATSERYVEYGADGRVIKGAPVAARQSRYAEDVHESGHDCVWGSSFWPRSVELRDAIYDAPLLCDGRSRTARERRRGGADDAARGTAHAR